MSLHIIDEHKETLAVAKSLARDMPPSNERAKLEELMQTAREAIKVIDTSFEEQKPFAFAVMARLTTVSYKIKTLLQIP